MQIIHDEGITLIAIRPAVPSDAASFVLGVEMASRGLFPHVFAGRTQHVLEELFQQSTNDNSYENSHFVTVDGQTAGMCCAYSGRQKHACTRRTNSLYLQYVGWHAIPVLWRAIPLLPLLQFTDHLPDEAFYILFLAVFPNFRGQGLSQRLLEDAEAAAIQQGCRALALDVDVRNTTAIRAYQKYGMKQAAASPSVRFQGEQVGLYRMEKALA